MRTLLCSSYRYGMTVTVILIIWDIHVSGADVIGIQHAEVGDPAHRQMLWPLRLTKYPRSRIWNGSTGTSEKHAEPARVPVDSARQRGPRDACTELPLSGLRSRA